MGWVYEDARESILLALVCRSEGHERQRERDRMEHSSSLCFRGERTRDTTRVDGENDSRRGGYRVLLPHRAMLVVVVLAATEDTRKRRKRSSPLFSSSVLLRLSHLSGHGIVVLCTKPASFSSEKCDIIEGTCTF